MIKNALIIFVLILSLPFLPFYMMGQTRDSLKCDDYFKSMEKEGKGDITTIQWCSKAPQLQEESASILSELCQIVLTNSYEMAVSIIIDKEGIPICIKTIPEISELPLRKRIMDMLYSIKFKPAYLDKEPVRSHFLLVLNSKKCSDISSYYPDGIVLSCTTKKKKCLHRLDNYVVLDFDFEKDTISMQDSVNTIVRIRNVSDSTFLIRPYPFCQLSHVQTEEVYHDSEVMFYCLNDEKACRNEIFNVFKELGPGEEYDYIVPIKISDSFFFYGENTIQVLWGYSEGVVCGIKKNKTSVYVYY